MDQPRKGDTTMRNGFGIGIFVLALGLIAATVFSHAAQTATQKQAANVPAAGQTGATGEFQPVQAKDSPAEIRLAIDKLQGAKNDLEHAGGEWGGHKANAINDINVALKELNLAADWARSHGTY
jgi:hypothetical protein